ncbi:M60 family metallopeptidase [candidate division KSB1 bacterium]|nr:M60 family metallopeptidase [candidate division KSB1 bacterium]
MGFLSVLFFISVAWSEVPDGYTFVARDGETIELETRHHVAYGANDGWAYRYGMIGCVECGGSLWGDPAPNQVKSCYIKEVDLNESTVSLESALDDLYSHLTNAGSLTDGELNDISDTLISRSYQMAYDTTLLKKGIQIVEYYEQNEGPLFINARTKVEFPREADPEDGRAMDRAVFYAQQGLFDAINDETLSQTPHLVDGLGFLTAAFFPFVPDNPAEPLITKTVKILASKEDDGAKPTMFTRNAARRPTGCYLPPGVIGEVTVPGSMVDAGYSILVGAHTDPKFVWGTLRRFDNITKAFPVVSTNTKIHNSFGGNVYVMVPYESNAGVVDVEISNILHSPFYSNKPFHVTSQTDWLNNQRNYPGPWADFESEKFMMTVPSEMIRDYDNATGIMEQWDLAMDGVSEVCGQPLVRNTVVLYLSTDVSIAKYCYSPGYPQVNTSIDPLNLSTIWYLRDPMYPLFAGFAEFHELTHAQYISNFPVEGESIVHVPYCYTAVTKFGWSPDSAFSFSNATSDYYTLDRVAIGWMVRPNFRLDNPMDWDEVSYQHRGHAKYQEIMTLFGYDVLSKFYTVENQEILNGTRHDDLTTIDSRIFRLSKAAGADLRPLIHFWGVHPDNQSQLLDSLEANNLLPSRKIYDRLLHYKDINPKDDRELYPTEEQADSSDRALDNIISTYFPDGAPASVMTYHQDDVLMSKNKGLVSFSHQGIKINGNIAHEIRWVNLQGKECFVWRGRGVSFYSFKQAKKILGSGMYLLDVRILNGSSTASGSHSGPFIRSHPVLLF